MLTAVLLIVTILASNLVVSADVIDGNIYMPGTNIEVSSDTDSDTEAETVKVANTANVDKAPNAIKGSSSSASSSSKGTTFTSKRVPYAKIKEILKPYQAKKSTVKGWLHLTNSNISYPIPQGKDNRYYVKRTWDDIHYPDNNYKNYRETANYMDYRVKIGDTWEKSSKNIVIYGHNWTNLRVPFDIGNVKRHTMFAQLGSYNDLTFSMENPYIYFSTEDMEGIWKIFGVAYSENDAMDFAYNTPNINAAQTKELIKEWEKRSLFKFDVPVDETDQFLTLSTCTRMYDNVGANQKFTVIARRLRPGEKDTDPVKAVANQKVKQPNFSK